MVQINILKNKTEKYTYLSNKNLNIRNLKSREQLKSDDEQRITVCCEITTYMYVQYAENESTEEPTVQKRKAEKKKKKKYSNKTN